MNNVLKKIDTSTTSDFFPKEFSNEVYYSKTKGFEPFSYRTNLTIKYVHEGYDNYKVGSHEHNLIKGQYLVLNPGNEVTCYSQKTYNEGMSVFMDASILSEVYKSHENVESIFDVGEKVNFNLLEFPHFCDDHLGRYIERLFTLSKHATSFDEIDSDQLLFYNLAELMITSQNQIGNRIKLIPRVKNSVRIEIYKRVMVAKNYLEENFRKPIKLDEVSRVAGISKYYLIKCFQQTYGQTPHNFVLDRRIASAKKELLLNHKSIQHISLENGFTDVSSFSKRFKKDVGVSPVSFRKRVIRL